MAGYFRLPGTYNSKAKKWGDFAFLHEDRLNVIDFYFDKVASGKKNPIPFTNSKKYALADYREHILYALLELRRKEGWVEDGYRDTFCFILFNTILEEYGEEKADEAVGKMNRSFSHPLSEKSLKSYLSTSRKKGYKFSNQTIINYLCITKEEQDMLHFHPSSKREEEREKKRQVKRERVQLVIELAKEGRSQREIAKMSGTSQSTVCRILRDPDKALAPRKTTANCWCRFLFAYPYANAEDTCKKWWDSWSEPTGDYCSFLLRGIAFLWLLRFANLRNLSKKLSGYVRRRLYL